MLVGVAASRTEAFRDQNHRLQSKFAYCKLFGVYTGVILKMNNSIINQQGILAKRKFQTFLEGFKPKTSNMNNINIHGTFLFQPNRPIGEAVLAW